VARHRLLEQVWPVPALTLSAPAGYGKTCFAAHVGAASGGPVAWFLADELDRDRAGVVSHLLGALGGAWADVGEPAGNAVLDDESAVPFLVALLETLAGPGCLVFDDAHLLGGEILDPVVRAVAAALPSDCRFVVCTRGPVPEPLLRAEAMGRASTLGPRDLLFDEDECGRICGSRERGRTVHARTGGWPLAVAGWARGPVDDLARSSPGVDFDSRLVELALSELSPAGRAVLTVLARVPRFPDRLIRRLGDSYSALETFGRRNPGLISTEDAWFAPREWFRDALRGRPADRATVDRAVLALLALDEDELAAQLLLAEARYEEAVPAVERLASAGMRQGRAAWVRSLVDSVPSRWRTFTLDLLAATAAQALNFVDPGPDGLGSEVELRALVDRASTRGRGAELQARALLASHYRMEGDPRLLAVCEEALGDAVRAQDPQTELRDRWSPAEVPAAADMLRLYGYALLFADRRDVVGHGRRLVAAALDLLDGAGHSTISQRGWSTYFEVLLFLRPAKPAVGPVRLAAHRTARLDHYEGAMRLAELATVEYFAGDFGAARRTIEMARDAAGRTGNLIAFAPLDSIEVALDVLDTGLALDHLSRFDDIATRLAAHPRLAPFAALITAEFGIVLVNQGELHLARLYLDRAEQALGDSFHAHTASFRCRRLRGLLLRAEGRVDEGRRVLDDLRRDAAAEGRDALVEILDADLARPRAASASPPALPPLVVHVLAPELSVTVNGDEIAAPRGYPAKLLALLVASSGHLTVDAAVEGLWPGADPDIGRNRLHGVLLRLRRGLGLAPNGPISCNEGVVRLERAPHLVIDSWEFERLAERVETRLDAIAAYGGDVLSAQFAYEDTVDAYGRSLRRTFLRLATAVLSSTTGELGDEQLAALARRAWAIAPHDEGVSLAAIRTLARLGHRAEACELLDGTVNSLADLGFDGDGFRRYAMSDLGAGHAMQ
jgi:DNA-binding SARP family transcriptional activator